MALNFRTISLLFVSITVLFSNVNCKTPCSFHMSVNISDGTTLKNGSILHEGLVYSTRQFFKYRNENVTMHTRGCLCLLKKCFRKCCPLGYAMERKQCVISSDPMVHPFRPQVYSDINLLTNVNVGEHFSIVYGNPCFEGARFMLNPYSSIGPQPEDYFFLQMNGDIFVPNHTEGSAINDPMLYCIDAWPKDPFLEEGEVSDWTTKILALVCFGHDVAATAENDIVYRLLSVGMMISVPFLIATFLVYALIPELQNLHGKALLCYLIGLIVAYISLIILQFRLYKAKEPIDPAVCFTFAFIIYFFFMVSFFWLNVMCFDVWWTFSGFRAHGGERRSTERRRFMYYCLYAWGLPLTLTLFCAVMQFHPNISSDFIKPGIGKETCWFPDWNSELMYFYIPVIILVVSNLLLFGSTAWIIIKVKRDTAVLTSGDSTRHGNNYKNDEQRFDVYLKLFFIMGMNWIAEWISFIVGGSKYLWIVTDLSNMLLGVLIFLLFVWKPKVKKLIKKRYLKIRYNESDSRAKSMQRSGNSTIDTERTYISSHEAQPIKLNSMT